MLLFLCLTTALAQDPPPEEGSAPSTPVDEADAAEEVEPSEDDSDPSEVTGDDPDAVEEEDPAPEEPPPTYSIDLDDSELGSALDDFADKSERYQADDPDRLEDFEWQGLKPQLFRGRWFVKPLISWARLEGGRAAVPLGLAAGHQWFPTSDSPLQLAGETRLDLSAPVGGAKGRLVQLASTLGPWIGPIGLRAGPVLRYDRWESDDALLDDALALGVRATAGLDAEYVKPWVGIEPVWLVAGNRESWGPGIGELSFLGGVQFATRMAHLGVAGTWRETAAGSFVQVALTVHVRPR